MKRITQKEIAAKLGVHISTVSLALKNDPRLLKKTRDLIHKTAKDLHYQPDPYLSALISYRNTKKQRPKNIVIGYITHWKNRDEWKKHHAHRRQYEGVLKKCQELGYSLEHFWIQDPIMKGRWDTVFKTRNINSLIIAPNIVPYIEINLEWECYRVIQLDPSLSNPNFDCVSNNQMNAIKMAMYHLRLKGIRKFGFLIQPAYDKISGNLWSSTFLNEQLKDLKQNRTPLFSSHQWNADAITKWYRRYRPEAILSIYTDVQDYLLQNGFQIPKDFLFINLDIDPSQKKKSIGVIQSHEKVGETAVEELDKLIHLNRLGIPHHKKWTLVDNQWIDVSYS